MRLSVLITVAPISGDSDYKYSCINLLLGFSIKTGRKVRIVPSNSYISSLTLTIMGKKTPEELKYLIKNDIKLVKEQEMDDELRRRTVDELER